VRGSEILRNAVELRDTFAEYKTTKRPLRLYKISFTVQYDN
jgi:hypothetical protein